MKSSYFKTILRFYPAIIIGIILSACQSNTAPNIDTTAENIKQTQAQRSELIKQIFYNIPSPIEMANLIQKTSVQYNPDLLSKYGREKEFLTQDIQALNLGVYGADLSYCRVFDQIQESIKYLSSIRYLTQSLQIPQDQSNKAVERLEKNLSNKDSLINVVIDLFTNADTYLKENQREGTAVLILVGSWVEGMYIATNLIPENTKRPEILEKIAHQKYSSQNLIKLLEPYAAENQFRQSVYEHLQILGKVFDNVVIEQGPVKVSDDVKNQKTVLQADSNYKITPETFKEIKENLAKIRSIITKE
jgi:hypothetical protein